MPRLEDVLSFGVTRIAVGLSALSYVRLNTIPSSLSAQFKILSGGSLEIVSGVSAGSDPALLRNTGYLVGSNEIVSVGGAVSMYLAATGNTCVVGMLIGKGNET